MQGWFKLHRELFETDLWHDVSTLRLFLYLLSQATHKEGIKTNGIELKRGQYIRSYRKLADDLSYKEGRGYKKYSLSTIKSCVNKLIDSERVNVKETEVGTLFTIVNYAKYQDIDEGNKRTPNGLIDKARTGDENEGVWSETPNAIEQITPETLNVKRTELGTEPTADKPFRYKGLRVGGKVSPNTLNGEVRTNAELTPNEVRTNSEQEQELKNLRIKELKDTTTTTTENPVQFFERLLCRLSEMQVQKLYAWQDDFDGQAEIINEAIRIADDKNKRFFGFVEYLLKEWANNNLKTIDRVRAYEQEKFNKAKVKPYQRKGTVRTEMLPEWFEESKQPKQEKKAVPEDDIARKKAELNEKLKKLRSGTES